MVNQKGNTLVILLLVGAITIGIILALIIFFPKQFNNENQQQQETPVVSFKSKVTNDPYNIQIRKIEEQYKSINLIDNSQLRNEFAWLISLWFAEDKTFNVLDVGDKEEIATRLYRNIEWIDNENDERRKGNEAKRAWTFAHKTVSIDLTGDPISLASLRKTLVHEFVHFIGGRRNGAISFSILKKSKPEYRDYVTKYIEGFKMGVDTTPANTEDKDKEFLTDFNEAVTELTSTHWLKTGGWEESPFYGKADVDVAIHLLQQTLDDTGITVEELARFNASSDLDGFAKKLAEASKENQSLSDYDKVSTGLWVIANIEKGNESGLEEFRRTISN
jgi:hypothetical protein